MPSDNHIQKLIFEFNKLPGIGTKTSEKFVYHLLKQRPEELDKLIYAVNELKKIKRCKNCFNFSFEQDLCSICTDQKRNNNQICVVAEIQTIASIEKTKEYFGLYHILDGYLSPMEGITPDKLKIKELVARIKNSSINEILFAFNPNIDGEATSIYLFNILKPYKIKITRLGRGISMGADLDYSDEITLSDALRGRKELK